MSTSAGPLRHVGARRMRGFGALAAIIVLVMLAALASAVVRLSWSAQTSASQDLQAARALSAAGAGLEWASAQTGAGGIWSAGCGAGQQATLNFRDELGMITTVRCTSPAAFNEGAEFVPGAPAAPLPRSVRVFAITAVACNTGGAACPDDASATGYGYVERSRSATVSR